MTPRETFQQDKGELRQHEDLADNTFLSHTFDVALLEMLWRQESTAPIQNGIRFSERLQGAKEFLEIWKLLSDKTKKETTPKDPGALEPDNPNL